MSEITLTLQLISRENGYDLLVTGGMDGVELGTSQVISTGIPTVTDAIKALVATLTAPMLITEDRIVSLEDATSRISDLLDRVHELELERESLREAIDKTKDAVLSLVAGGIPSPGSPIRTPLPPTRQGPVQNPDAGVGLPGFAGTFRKPLEEGVHAAPGKMMGGAFRGAGSGVPLPELAPPPGFGDEKESEK